MGEVPYLFDLEEMITWATARSERLSPDEALEACLRLGRASAPHLFGQLHEWSLLQDEAYYLASSIWSMAEIPDRTLTRRSWREIFDRAGYCVDGHPRDRPRLPMTLYRGSPEEFRLNWSWTDSLETARDFASGRIWGRSNAVVWTATVEPWRLLAKDNGREESEYVVYTRGLRPTQLRGE